MVIGVGASFGLFAIIEPTNTMLFENNAGSSVLAILSFVILFSSVITTIIAIMQGLGLLLFPAAVILASIPIKYGLNMILVPMYGTKGAAAATLLTLLVICLILWLKFKRIQKIQLLHTKFIVTVSLAALIMVLFLKAYLALTGMLPLGGMRAIAAIQAISGAGIGGFLFLLIVIRGGVFLEKELTLFPFGSKLSLLLPQRKRS